MCTEKNIVFKRKRGKMYHGKIFQKIARYYLSRHTHVRDLGGGGVLKRRSPLVTLPPPACFGASERLTGSESELESESENMGKHGMLRNPSLFRCEKSSERCKLNQMENYSARVFLRALKCFIYHTKARKIDIFWRFMNSKLYGFSFILEYIF
jgi:hypothetical protein